MCSSDLCEVFKIEPDYEKIADGITVKTAEKLEQEHGLILVGIGGQMMHDIQMMSMSFFLYHEVSLEEARKLIVYSVEEYLSNINSNEKIRPYLHEYPFTAKNVEVWLWLYDIDHFNLPKGTIHHVLAENETISYFIKGEKRRKTLHEESYEQAKSLVFARNKHALSEKGFETQ